MNKAKYKIWTGGYMLKPEDYPLSFPFYVGAFDGKVYQGELEKGEYSLIETSFLALPYIGLKDKNGKEIYESDIVSVKYIYDKRTTDRAQVVWREDKAGFGLKSLKGLTNEVYELYKITAEHNLEVIGNIYENPKLLKDNL